MFVQLLSAVFACWSTLLGVQFARAGITGLALPPLDATAAQFGGTWASANSLVFLDLMKHSLPFSTGSRAAGSTSGSWGYLNPQSITWRPDGYAAGLVPPNNRTVWSVSTTIGEGGAYYPAGRYVVLYDGEGTLELDGDAASPSASSSPGRILVDVTPSTTGLRLRITASSPANPLVRIRIVPAAYEANHTAQLFHPDFLDMLRGFRLLRFTAWMRTSGRADSNQTNPRDWAARTTPDHNTQVREADGVAVEHLVALANMLNVSMWVSLPRPANDSDPYTAGMLSYMASRLGPGLGLTVEYGTEGPGWLSSQLPNATRLLAGIARRVWAAAGRPAGLLRVVQTAPGAVLLGNLLQNSDLSHVDAIAMPASFGGSSHWVSHLDNPTAWSDPAFLASAPRNMSLDNVMQLIRSSVIMADLGYNKQLQALRARNLPLLGYAGGPDMMGPSYGARSNYDRALRTCGLPSSTWPCTVSILYPPWTWSGGPSSATWADQAAFNATLFGPLAANASAEAAAASALRTARTDARMYDIMLDSLWRWHGQMGGGDLVVDLAFRATPCTVAPGAYAGLYNPDECKGTAAARATIVGRPTEAPVYQALRAWLAAVEAATAPGSTVNASAAPGKLPQSSATAPPAVPPPAANCSAACVYGSCIDGSCVCWAGASGAACEVLSTASSGSGGGGGGGGTPSACNTRLGVNLEGISDWSRSWTFVNVFKASRDWIPQTFTDYTWNTNAPINLTNTTDGPGGRAALDYPASLAANQRVTTLVLRDVQGHAPEGVYTVLYDGKGLLDFSMADVKEVVHVGAGHARVRFKSSTDMNNGIGITIERTDPTDPLRNIRVLTPGYEAAAEWGGRPFHPALPAFLRPFGTLRFMDWMNTNAKDVPTTWEQRPRPEDRSYATNLGGVPLEHMLQLANTLGSDPWFNMPYAATDDYIARFATAVRDGLRPDVKVFVEYGNELWHTGFPGGQYAQSQGLALNTTEEGNKWYGGATNEARLCFVAQRTANISKLWKAVWGAQAGRVNVVVSGQAVWPITSAKLLSCGGSYKHIDALAIGPYFGSYDKNRDTNLTVFMTSTLPAQVNDTLGLVKQHAAIAASYGKPLLCYEAGQGLVGDGSSTDLAIQANRDPRMADVYQLYLSGLAAANVSRILHYSSISAFSRSGSWGLMEWQDADRRDAPKYQAAMSFINATATCSLPAPPAASTCPGGDGAGGACSGSGECLPGGACLCYTGHSGPDCSNTTYTEKYNCGYKCTFDGGWCNASTVVRTTRTWGCTCKPGLAGLTCSIVSCPNSCSWNGECLDQGICACFPGFFGPDCSGDCGCGGHGTCDGSGGCVCDAGWRKGASGKCEWDCSGCSPGTSCIGPGECGCTERCVYGTCFHGACRCWAGFGGPACGVSEDAPAAAAAAVSVNASTGSNNSIGGAVGAGATLGRLDFDFVPRMNRGSLAGVNLGGLSYWSTEWVWLDAMKGSSRWYTSYAPDTSLENLFDTNAALDLRPDGYPARLPPGVVAHKLMLRDMQLHAWPGRYVVLYDGEGRLDFEFDATVVSRAKGRVEILLTPTADLACAATGAAYCGDNGLHLTLTATNPANPLRNIRVLPSGDGAAASAGGKGAGGAWEGRVERAPFHPWFLKSLSRYRVIRFMNWMSANSDAAWAAAAASPGGAWGARTTPAHDTQARPLGVALEHIAQLCNLLGADPWLTVHHLADDAYVAAMAALLRDSLRPDLKVYVEHSNEVWNGLFPQFAYSRDRGLAMGLSNDSYAAAYRYHALRTVQIGQIFRSVFASTPPGGANNGSAVSGSSDAPVGNGTAQPQPPQPPQQQPQRVVVVLGGWGYLCSGGKGCGATVMRETLGWNGTAAKVDYYGVTGYWDCGLGGNGPSDVLLSVDQMLSKCSAALNATEADARALAAAAAPYGVPLITYEAGPSIVESSAISGRGATVGLADKLIAVNRHATMYGLYRSYLEAYGRAGLVGPGRPFMQFVSTAMPTKYGSWGLQEYTGQPVSDAPKYRALMDWLDAQAVLSSKNASGTSGRLRPLCMSLRSMGGASGAVSGAAGGGGSLMGEGVLAGAPAVLMPAAGQVLVQGLTAPIRWSTVGWPTDTPPQLEITLWMDSDCDPASDPALQRRLPASRALVVLAGVQASSQSGYQLAQGIFTSGPGALDWQVPLASELAAVLAAALATAANATADAATVVNSGISGGNSNGAASDVGRRRLPRFFIRISDGATANYSEPFDIRPPYDYVTGPWSACDCGSPSPRQTRDVVCVTLTPGAANATSPFNYTTTTTFSPLDAPPSAPASCGSFPGWNITLPTIPGDPQCSIDPTTGCRTYRTSKVGAWYYSAFKPVTDCTAQSSPWPLPAYLAAASAFGVVNGSSGSGSNGPSAGPAAPQQGLPAGVQAVPLAVCAAQTGAPAPPTTQACPTHACSNGTTAGGGGTSGGGSTSGGATPTGGWGTSGGEPLGGGTSGGSGASNGVNPPDGGGARQLPFCELASTEAVVAALNAGSAACNAVAAAGQQGCGEGEVCTALPGCATWACNPAALSLEQAPCSARCLPAALKILAAQLSDDGRRVRVTLSAAAAPLRQASCGAAFDAASSALLGGGGAALCSTEADGKVLTITLPANATLLPGNTLALRQSGCALVSAFNASQPFAGNITVSPCASCAAPSVLLSGPPGGTIPAATCEPSSGSLLAAAAQGRPPATFDASASADPSGRTRWAGVRWAVLLEYGSAAGRVVLQAAVDRVNNLTDVGDRLRWSLTAAEAASLEEGIEYRLQVTLTSWLGTSVATHTSFTRAASGDLPAPSVTITGPPAQTARIGAGLRLTAELLGGGCKGRSVVWNWTSPSNWSALPASGRSGQTLSIPGPLPAVHGQSMRLRVTASYTGGATGASASTDVTVTAVGSPPFTALTGPNGDVPDDQPLTLNASASSDPDLQLGGRPALSFTWECRRDDYPAPCFPGAQQGNLSSTRDVWVLPAGLLTNDRWHTFTVTASKAVAADSTQNSAAAALSASASVTFRPRSASVAFPRASLTRQCASVACTAPHSTNRDLTVLLQLTAPYNTPSAAASLSITWSSPEAPAVASLVPASAANDTAYLLTLPAVALPSSRDSISITANMTVAGTGVSGVASVTVLLNAAPYCTLSTDNSSACLSLQMLNTTFPFAAALLTARGWADGGRSSEDSSSGGSGTSLMYEFGLRRPANSGGKSAGKGGGGGSSQVQQLGASSSATLVGLPQGTSQLYVCAIDASGSRACGVVNVTVQPPPADFDAGASLTSVNVSALVEANDQHALLQAAQQMAQLVAAAAAASAGNTTSASALASVSQLVSNRSMAMVKAILGGGALQDALQAQQAVSAIASLAASAASLLPDSAKEDLLAAAKLAAQTLPGANSSFTSTDATATTDFVTQLCRLLGLAMPSSAPNSFTLGDTSGGSSNPSSPATTTNTISGRRRSLPQITTTTTADNSSSGSTTMAAIATAQARLLSLLSVSNQLGDALGRLAVPGGSYLAAGDGGVYVSVVAIVAPAATTTVTTLVSAELHAGPSAAVLSTSTATTSDDSSVIAVVVLSGSAASGAASYGISLQYAPSAAAALGTALASALPAGVSVRSGLVSLTWNAGSGAAALPTALDGNHSYILLLVPVTSLAGDTPLYDTACLSYDASSGAVSGSLSGVALGSSAGASLATVLSSYDALSGRVACRLGAVGSYVIVQGPRATVVSDGGAKPKSKSNVGAIVGGAVGGGVGLLFLVLLVLLLVVVGARRRKHTGSGANRVAPDPGSETAVTESANSVPAVANDTGGAAVKGDSLAGNKGQV